VGAKSTFVVIRWTFRVFPERSKTLSESGFEAVSYVEPSPAQAICPEHNRVPPWSPCGAMLLLGLLKQGALILETLPAFYILERQNKIFLR
jgi:hypothetical protein